MPTNPALLNPTASTPEDSEVQEVKPVVKKAPRVALVVDTNVFLKQTRLPELLKCPDLQAFNDKYEVFTLQEVIKEIKDEQSRLYVENGIQYPMQIKSADTFLEKSDHTHVDNFAKDTGDFFNLSTVDKSVIALGVRLAKQRDQYDKVRVEPKPL